MSTVTLTASEEKDFYGLTSIQTYPVFESTLPLQVLGLVPCKRFDSSDCLDDITQCLPVFSNTTDKDYSYFYLDYTTDQNTPEFELYQYNNNSETFVSIASLNDSTYGTFSDFGSYTSNSLRAGFVIDWALVEAAFGEGFYKFVVNDNSTYTNGNLSSYPFQLKVFSCSDADRTVKIKCTYRGLYDNFDTNGSPTFFDTREDDLSDEIRLNGIFEPDLTFETEKTFVTLSGGARIETMTREAQIYNMYLADNTYELLLRLWKYGMSSQGVKITDYAQKALFENFIDVDVIAREAPTIPGATQLEYVSKIPQAQYQLTGNQSLFRSC